MSDKVTEPLAHQWDIVQLVPGKVRNPMFSACCMVVSEVRSWGVMGYVQALGKDGNAGGQAYYRATWDEVVPTGGRAVIVSGAEEDA